MTTEPEQEVTTEVEADDTEGHALKHSRFAPADEAEVADDTEGHALKHSR